ncbi:electron transfer flavoprotein subunit beta/FixA family protein [Caballeronia sp. LZ062]|uniref:electron transfer flavoprotein subunit beta/FixA family protein n=1 Tax=unclassified Caballeronia TaxID=2646786 RepID=UPI00285D7FE7|nr:MULTISPECIES: electron transfer flavoprotein subunit beta/FixA family protein [unclassified Caballeronia]MDR5857041.1 electron transfer flavoprotein subunit beta/FixA family protein [Caballeronia sp. LZ050]MDR5869562.1 electron transfer flavoprotein subunit beta/FixA family protein [Caballeronia sp. LZ062]
MKIAVLVSVGCHPVSGVARYSRNDAAALTIALDIARQHGAQLDVLHAGDLASLALAEYLALGAQRVEVLNTDGDACAALAQRIAGYDLVMTGTRAEGAFDSGTLPYKLANALNIALVGSAVDVSVTSEGVDVRQFMPKGLRRRVRVQLPALVAVHPLANAAPRYAYARMREGHVVPVAAHAPVDNERKAWTLGPIAAKPKRLAAPEKRSGHARMLSATTTESRGGSVVIEGSSVEKAQVILAYLREHRLVDY